MATDNQALLLQVSADIRSLEKQFARAQGIVDKGSRAMENRAKQAGTNLERFFGKTDPGKALDKIFDSTRFRVLDTGAAKIGLFGSALESLGPAGLTAAAGVGALGLALAGARDAARFADDISDTADRLHVTTDALQEYRYAIRAAGGEEKGADEALESFSQTLGKAQEGLPKAQKGFLALRFTKEQIKGFTDAETTLPKIATALQGLSDAQKDAAISQLGLDGLKQLLVQGPDAMARLRDEAHKLGIVMDADLVKRGGELNDQFETVSKVIDVQLKSALVDLGPVLVGLLKLVGEIVAEFSDLIESFKEIENRRTTTLQRQRDTLTKELGIMQLGGNNPVTAAARREKQAQIASIDAELAKSSRNPAAPTPPKPAKTLADLSKTGAGKQAPPDKTEQRIQEVNATLAGSGKDLYQAMLALTANVEARAEIEKHIADQEALAAQARLDKQIADVKGDKGINDEATRRALVAQLEIAKQNEQEAADARKAAIERQAAFDVEDRQIEIHTAIAEALIEQLQAEADIATTAAARQAIEKRILDLRQQLARDLEGTKIDRRVATGELSPEEAARLKGAQGVVQGAEQARFADANKSPFQKYVDSIRDVDTAFQNMEVNGVQGLIDGLAAAGAGAANLGDVFRKTIQQMAIDANRILLQSLLTGGSGGGGGLLGGLLKIGASAYGGGIPGRGIDISGLAGLYAGGTNSTAPGDILVGEHGPEILRQKGGHQVIPNDILRNLSRQRAAATTAQTWAPVLQISVMGAMSAADARRTGQQIGSAAMREMSMAKRRGY